MSTLVTGGKGFIGARIIGKLVARGEEVVCLDLKATGGRLAALSPQVTMVSGDVSQMSLEDLVAVIRDYRVKRIAHMVYFLGEGEALYREMLIMGLSTWKVYEAARLTGVKRILFPSSMAYHGPQGLHGERPLTEDDPPLDRTVYGVTKNLNETLALEYNKRFGMSIISVRVSVVYGPGAKVGGSGVNLAQVNAALGIPAQLPYPEGERVCLCHVDDLAEVFVRLLQVPTPKHYVYQVGGHTVTYGEIAALVKEFIPDAQISFNDGAERIPYPWLLDSSRLRQDLGFEHRSLREGFLELINLTRQEAGLPTGGKPRD